MGDTLASTTVETKKIGEDGTRSHTKYVKQYRDRTAFFFASHVSYQFHLDITRIAKIEP